MIRLAFKGSHWALNYALRHIRRIQQLFLVVLLKSLETYIQEYLSSLAPVKIPKGNLHDVLISEFLARVLVFFSNFEFGTFK